MTDILFLIVFLRFSARDKPSLNTIFSNFEEFLLFNTDTKNTKNLESTLKLNLSLFFFAFSNS